MTCCSRSISVFAIIFLVSALALAQKLTTLANFNGQNGARPQAPLIQGLDGELYGTTEYGGANTYYGEAFKVSSTGNLTILNSFCYSMSCAFTDGAVGGLLQTRNGDLYGTTFVGGPRAFGNIYKISGGSLINSVANFTNQNGANPPSSLVEGADGNFYGVAEQGDQTNQLCFFGLGCGTVFKLSPQGKITVLYAFCSETDCVDGVSPSGTLLQASDGNFYGTANAGGSFVDGGCLAGGGCGTIFKITPGGVFMRLHAFGGQDGANPYQVGLVQGSDGDLYGTTYGGGSNSSCSNSDVGCGTIFKVSTRPGPVTTLYSFCGQPNCADGAQPYGGLVLASDGNFYGTTYNGGAYNFGTIFRLTPDGQFTSLYSFCAVSGCPDGEYPDASLFQATDGRLYGVTFQGGTGQGFGIGGGTVFRFDLGLPRFVSALPGFGKVGQTISILGNNLMQASSVSFNGVTAQFTAVSGTQLTATVPGGATTGLIEVITPIGTLMSKTFVVR